MIELDFAVESLSDAPDFDSAANCIQQVFAENGKTKGSCTVVFCDDEFLRKMKIKYFDEDAYTDTITFNLEEKGSSLEGEMYISIPRVRENASEFSVSANEELMRVLVHSALHLCGFNDKSEEEQEEMCKKEDSWLEKCKAVQLISQ